MAPVKPVTADGVVPTSLFAAIRVDPKGKAVLGAPRARSDPVARGADAALAHALDLRAARTQGRPAGGQRGLAAPRSRPPRSTLRRSSRCSCYADHVGDADPAAERLGHGRGVARERRSPAAPVEGTLPIEQLDTPPVPKKQPWSSSSYKGPFSVKFWVRINASGHVEKSDPVSASDPVLVAYFRKAIASWLFRPARAGNAAVATWNELSLSGQIAYSTDLKLTTSLRQPF